MSKIQEHSASVLGLARPSQTRGPYLAAAVVAFASLLGGSAPVFAQSGIDRCDAILQQDLFNRVSNSTQSSSSERAVYEKQLFKMTETEAAEDYEKKFASSKAEATSGATEFHYGIIGGELEFSHSYDRKLSSEDFKKTFKAAKERYEQKESSSTARDASLISLYQSSVRDAGTVSAWERCMVTKYPEPGLFAYGFRDPSGSPYITVVWAPGTFAAANPTITVRVVPTEPDMTIEGAGGAIVIATGSGAAFPVRFEDPDNRKATADGFTVLVNGELMSGDRLVQSFRAEATVPRNLGPMPCDLVLSENGHYELGLTGSWDPDSPTTTTTVWGIDVVILSTELPEPGVVIHSGTMQYRIAESSPEPIHFRLTGNTATLVFGSSPTVCNEQEGPRKARCLSNTDPRTAQSVSGVCTGQGITGRWPVTRFDVGGQKQFAIRPAR
jgi:hypothetical protein